MKHDSYSDPQAHASFQPRSSQPAIDPTQFGQPAQHSSSTSAVGAKWLNKASGWMANKLQTAQNFVNDSGGTIAPDQMLPGLKGTVKPALAQADPANQPLVGVIDAGFGTDEHGSKMVEAIQKESPQAKLWQGGGVGTGDGLESLTEFVDAAKATGQSRAVANLSFDLTEKHPDGSTSTRAQLTAKEQSALAYARDNGVLVVASAGNQGDAMSALGQASQPSDNLIVVGAANGNDRASYSSYGKGLDLVADVDAAGTSAAAAKVTGTIAKLWNANPGLNSQQVEQMLTTTATDLKTPGRDAETGAGLLNTTGAIALATHTAPEAIVFSGAQLMQQVSESKPLAGATWESRNGSVASERTNRLIGDSPKEDAEIRAVLRSRAQAKQKPLVPKATPAPKAELRSQASLNALIRKDKAFNVAPAKPAPTVAPRSPAPPTPVELHRQEERNFINRPRPAQPAPKAEPRSQANLDALIRKDKAFNTGGGEPTPRPIQTPPPTPTPHPAPMGGSDSNDTSTVVSDVGHTVLDVIGLTPVGFLADGANAVWYAAEGDYENAAVSALGILPGGEAATGARLVNRASQLVNRASETYGAIEDARGIVEGVSEVANGNFNSGDAAFTLAETVFSSRGRRDRPTGPSAGNDRNGELNVGGAGNPPPQNSPRNGGSSSRSGSEPDARGIRDRPSTSRSTPGNRDRQPAAPGGLRGDQIRPSTAGTTQSATTRNQQGSGREIVTVGARDRARPSTDRSTADSRDRQPVAVGAGNGGARPSSPSTTRTTPGATPRSDRNSRADSAPAPRSGGSGNSNKPPQDPPTGGGGSRPTGGYDDSNNNGSPAGNDGNSGNSGSPPNLPLPPSQSSGDSESDGLERRVAEALRQGRAIPDVASDGDFRRLSASEVADAIRSSQRARSRLDSQDGTSAATENGSVVRNGFVDDPELGRFLVENRDDVNIKGSGRDARGDDGNRIYGSASATHAEPKLVELDIRSNPESASTEIAVDRPVCRSRSSEPNGSTGWCVDDLSFTAMREGRTIVVAEPGGVWVFHPDIPANFFEGI